MLALIKRAYQKRNTKSFFIGLVIVIVAFGTWIRFIDYDSVPGFRETNDEFFYPWAGMTLIKNGVPVGWSWFSAYGEPLTWAKWGDSFPIVSPWLEKPPLYSLMTGLWMMLFGADDIGDVRLSQLRIFPILLSIITMIFLVLTTKKIFGKTISILALLIYATTPSIVMGNRLSLTENLLTPLMLFVLYIILVSDSRKLSNTRYSEWLVSAGIFLAAITKQIGVIVGVFAVGYYFFKKRWRGVFMSFAFMILGSLVNPILGWYYGWDVYSSVTKEFMNRFRDAGLPELTQTILSMPIITNKDKIFMDGVILFGLILFFTIAFRYLFISQKISGLRTAKTDQSNTESRITIFFALPIGYFAILSLLAAGPHPSFYGWYLFPLYPFLTVLVAWVFTNTFRSLSFFSTLIIVVILGSSAIRFVFLFLPRETWKGWQVSLGVLILTTLLFWILKWKILRRLFFATFLSAVILINVYTTINLNRIYGENRQPLSLLGEKDIYLSIEKINLS